MYSSPPTFCSSNLVRAIIPRNLLVLLINYGQYGCCHNTPAIGKGFSHFHNDTLAPMANPGCMIVI